jgi:hypothetical protein
MKKMFNKSLLLLLVLSQVSCKESASKEKRYAGDNTQRIELKIDGNKRPLDPTAIISSTHTNAHLMLLALSEKDDIQLGISAYMQELKIGSYQVYDCKAAGECDDKMPDNNQFAIYGPGVKNQVPSVSLSRTAYYAPKLGLKPLTLVISSIADEKQAGNPFMTKRIKGQFSGNLAYAERQKGGYDWFVVKTTQVDGSFDLLCNIR